MEIKEEIIEEIQILDDQADLNKVFINWIKLAQLILKALMKIKIILDGNTRGNNKFRKPSRLESGIY